MTWEFFFIKGEIPNNKSEVIAKKISEVNTKIKPYKIEIGYSLIILSIEEVVKSSI